MPQIQEVLSAPTPNKTRTLPKYPKYKKFWVPTPNKSRTLQSSAFQWNNSRTSEIDAILSSDERCESSGFTSLLSSGIKASENEAQLTMPKYRPN